jgi:hypothetical protein
MTKKWVSLSALLFGGATVFHSGCLSFGSIGSGEFWDGMWNSGWPTNNAWLNIGIDVLKEELFG